LNSCRVGISPKGTASAKRASHPFAASLRSAGELASRWHQILPSLLSTYEKLKKLGFTYSDGKVSIIVAEKEDSGV